MPRPFRRQCPFCQEQIEVIDYKDADLLREYLNPYAKIMPRKRTGVCSKHQRVLARAIKRARYLALIPFTQK